MTRTAAVAIALVLLTSACGSDTADDTSFSQSGLAAVEIVIVDGDQELDRCCEELTAWSFQRFTAADLPPPEVTRIVYDHTANDCPGRAGWTEPDNAGAEVHICLPSHRLCSVGDMVVFTVPARVCVLHELAHVWMLTNVSPTTEEAFVRLNDLDSWYSLELPWRERGVEFAAEVMAWGLMDARIALHRLDHPDCDRLVAGFELLTGVAPLVSCDDPQRPG